MDRNVSRSPEAVAARAARTIALQMLEERGRGAVLVGVARVDAALESLLQAVMAPCPTNRDELFRPERPLGSFGAKVALAHRLGLINDPIERALSVLRKLRNSFAHSADSATLTDEPHSKRLEATYAQARKNQLWSPLEGILDTQSPPENGDLPAPLRDYILLITILVALLEVTASQAKPIESPIRISF